MDEERPPEQLRRRHGLTPRRVAVVVALALLAVRVRRQLRYARNAYRYRRQLRLALTLLLFLRQLRRR